jgi:hypothetical protein
VTGKLITAREVRDRLRLRRTETVLRWHRQGKLEGGLKLPNGALRFDEAAIERQLEEWATPGRGDVTHPDGRRPAGTVELVTHPRS